MSLTLVREAEAAAAGKLSVQAVQGSPPASAAWAQDENHARLGEQRARGERIKSDENCRAW
jgi:hypothetical protein